jgi:hypothetical protein
VTRQVVGVVVVGDFVSVKKSFGQNPSMTHTITKAIVARGHNLCHYRRNESTASANL